MSTFLGIPIITPVTIESERVKFTARTNTLSRTTVLTDAHVWRLSLGLKPDTDGSENALGKLLGHRERYADGDSFSIVMPQPPSIIVPTAPIRIVAAGGAAIGENTLNLQTMSGGVEQVIKSGTFFTINNDLKVYVVTDDYTIPLSDSQEVRFEPAAQVAKNPNQTLNFAPNIQVRYDPDTEVSYTLVDGRVFSARVELEEVV